MSVRCIDRVWQGSIQQGTRLLVLLALADRAGDDGFCWPGIAEIAQRARISERQAQYHIRALEKDKEIICQVNRGRTHSNRYIVTIGLTDEEIQETVKEKMKYIAHIDNRKDATDCTVLDKRCNPVQEKVQSSAVKGAIAIAPEPSITVNEPSISESKLSDSAGEKPSPTLTVAGKEYFKQFNRKRWGTPAQRDLFEQTEHDVGTDVMLKAVKWAAVKKIADVQSIASAARTMMKKRDKANDCRNGGTIPMIGGKTYG